mmetsp:Transcript_26701/g.44826  ORF Transcript_26701/g.44826 Transcript_26701/m.44826 type:complete len:95 (+) Transcript_26701:34-318(+)
MTQQTNKQTTLFSTRAALMHIDDFSSVHFVYQHIIIISSEIIIVGSRKVHVTELLTPNQLRRKQDNKRKKGEKETQNFSLIRFRIPSDTHVHHT